jgi:hypothetical protein
LESSETPKNKTKTPVMLKILANIEIKYHQCTYLKIFPTDVTSFLNVLTNRKILPMIMKTFRLPTRKEATTTTINKVLEIFP